MERRFLTNEEIEAAEPEELALRFMPLAEAYAAKIRPGCEDTRGDAYVGLVRAAELYDSSQGPFVPYATLWIRQAVRRGAGGQRNAVWLPPQVRERLAEMLDMQNRLPDDVDDTHLAAALGRGWTADEVARMRRAARAVPVHASAPQRDSDSDPDEDFGSLLTSVDDDTDEADARVDLAAIIEDLPADIAVTAEAWLADPDTKQLRRVASQIRNYLQDEWIV